jgi:hypothetical protein
MSPTARREDHLAIGIGHDGKRVVSPRRFMEELHSQG